MNVFSPRGTALALSALILSACGGGDGDASEAAENADESAPVAEAAAAPDQPTMVKAPEGSLAGNDMALGRPDAPLTITEFASVTCPGCAGFHAAHFPTIKEELIDTGQVRFVYKEFPTPPVRLSQAGFILARCAATETGADAYFAMIDALYKTQRTWIGADNPGNALRNIAAQAGLSEDEFDTCFQREDIRDAIVGNIAEGRGLGLTGTPSFVVDGRAVPLRGTTEEVIAAIKAEIAKAQ